MPAGVGVYGGSPPFPRPAAVMARVWACLQVKEERCRVGRDSVAARPGMDNAASVAGGAVSPSSGSGGKAGPGPALVQAKCLEVSIQAQVTYVSPGTDFFAVPTTRAGPERKRLTATNKMAEVHSQPQTLTHKKAHLVFSHSRL